jgi:hypothetical protein
MTGGLPGQQPPFPALSQWLIDWPFVNYTAGQNFYCPDGNPLHFFSSALLYRTKTPVCSVASYKEAKFIFMPVPGDLTGDGKVDITDLTIIAGKYGLTYLANGAGLTWDEFRKRYYYDFNKDLVIDIFDIIVVSKNFGAECPF